MSASWVEVVPHMGSCSHVVSVRLKNKDSQKKDSYLKTEKTLTTVGSFDYSVRNGFLTQLKSKEVEVKQEIMVRGLSR